MREEDRAPRGERRAEGPAGTMTAVAAGQRRWVRQARRRQGERGNSRKKRRAQPQTEGRNGKLHCNCKAAVPPPPRGRGCDIPRPPDRVSPAAPGAPAPLHARHRGRAGTDVHGDREGPRPSEPVHGARQSLRRHGGDRRRADGWAEPGFLLVLPGRGPGAGDIHAGLAGEARVRGRHDGRVLTEGPYNGSTLVVAGRDDTSEEVRELAVVGGTGMLRRAAGHVLWKTARIESKVHAVLELDVHASGCS
ncbi:hypothetical protein BRADI_5g08107v3 [Brachypodium distachyon]|uniref:Dirigent protein n=1 Tax=Brachypodium distachyon TaxID=15368 RepID=A0A2K2CFW1_BRADI|nr:hypothetical protein BRADI_5g08107v3 [Brachypodium distachyon]